MWIMKTCLRATKQMCMHVELDVEINVEINVRLNVHVVVDFLIPFVRSCLEMLA